MRRLSPSLVLSVIAVVFALSGSAIAAHHYLITSTSQIKPSVLKKLHGKRGPAGYDGTNGAAGAPGAPGMSNFTVVESPHVDVPPGGNTPVNWDANCPAGTKVVGTGFYISIADVGFVKAYGTFVGGIAFNNTGVTAHDLHLQAMCATVAGAAARSARSVRAVRSRFEADRAAVVADR